MPKGNFRRKFFWSLIFISFGFVISYIYFVQSSVFYLVSSHTYGSKQGEISAKATSLEAEFYKLSQTINPRAGLLGGLVEAKEVSFVEKDTSVSLNTSGRGAR